MLIHGLHRRQAFCKAFMEGRRRGREESRELVSEFVTRMEDTMAQVCLRNRHRAPVQTARAVGVCRAPATRCGERTGSGSSGDGQMVLRRGGQTTGHAAILAARVLGRRADK